MTYFLPCQQQEFSSVPFKGLRNTKVNDGNPNWGEPEKKIFLNSFGEFWITDRKVNTSFERKKENASKEKP